MLIFTAKELSASHKQLSTVQTHKAQQQKTHRQKNLSRRRQYKQPWAQFVISGSLSVGGLEVPHNLCPGCLDRCGSPHNAIMNSDKDLFLATVRNWTEGGRRWGGRKGPEGGWGGGGEAER